MGIKSLEEIKKILRDHEKMLSERFKVKSIMIFGSYARNEQKEGSDVDIIVDFSEPIGLEFIDLKEYLEEILRMKVDLVTPRAIREKMRKSILKEAVNIK
ncbi:nucleotidyltransferase family protein [Mesoaciditoga lauensis]|uniref:nucleotidyltransferase family protein n=1 Tax=Mesoaciditoga lauensis TaxID=1495039 RepID=UPI000A7AFB90|nr:nucleotidyltransferase family protein [Mesoaciditoga lauensis]